MADPWHPLIRAIADVSELLYQAIARLRRARGGALVETEPDEEAPRG